LTGNNDPPGYLMVGLSHQSHESGRNIGT
jgi:hypothetical protein